jgi:phage portal protein BeeE
VGLVDFLLGRDSSTAAPSAITVPGQVYPTSVPYLDGRTAVGISAVWRCVSLIADAIADLPWRELTGPELAPVELAPSRLVRRPMATMTRREWTWRVVATEALYSTAHCLKVGGSDAEGLPWSLLPIPPDAIMPADPGDPWGMLPPSAYWVGSQRVEAEHVVAIRRSPFPGIPDHLAGVIRLARRQFSSYLAADVVAARYWAKGGPPVDVLTTEQDLTDPEADRIAQRWADRRAMGADFPAVLGKGAKAQPYGADPTAESAVEARREMVAEVGRYFGVQPRTLNAPAGDSQTYANVEDDAVDLERYTLRGYMGPVEDAISELLPGDYQVGRRMRMDTIRLTQGNLESRARAYPLLVRYGILDVDEARARGFGLAPRPAGTPAAPALAADEALPGAMVAVSGGGLNP